MITYYIGAGASCYSQPLVANMKERMMALLYLLDPNNGTSDDSKLKQETKVLFDKFNPIVIEACKHYTVDTYAKKLWLTGERAKLKILKEYLNLYFLFEQDFEKSIYKRFPDYNKGSIWEQIGTNIDYRYDVFFATLLENNNEVLHLPDTINIISWNYDNQFEYAYREFLKEKYVEDTQTLLNIYPTQIGNSLQREISKIIRLNGACNILHFKAGDLIEITFAKQLEYLLGGVPIANQINFAWEKDNPNQKNGLEHAKKILQGTKELVIIGYSFPIFNKEIDTLLLTEGDFQKIYIQVPTEKEFNKVRSRICNMTEYEENSTIFEHVDDPDQFYIPL